MTNAIGYARLSKYDPGEGRGVERQRQDIAAVCEQHGWTLTGVLVDNDISASRYSRKPRDGYQRLVSLITSGAVERVVIYDADRLLRQPRELEDLIDLAERNGSFEIHTVTGQIDLVTSAGRFIARSLVAKAAMESDDLSRRLRRAFDQKAAEGRPHGARAFGYEPDGITIRESEAALLRQAACDVLAGETLAAIARRWNAAGIVTPQRRSAWDGTIVKAVLTNPRHAGIRVHRRGKPDEARFPASWLAVIDVDTHRALVSLLTDSDRRQAIPPRRTAFTGLVRSAVTKLPLDRDVRRGRAVYMTRRRPGRDAVGAQGLTIPAGALERLILAMLFEAVDSGHLARRIAARRARREGTKGEDPAVIERALVQLAEDEASGLITRAEWLAKRERLQQRLQTAQAAQAVDPVAIVLEGVTGDLEAAWPAWSVDRQRAILAATFNTVLIHPSTRRGGPAPFVEGIGRIDVARVEPDWRV